MFEKLKNLFIVEEGNTKKSVQKEQGTSFKESSPKPKSKTTSTPTSQSVNPKVSSGKVSEKFNRILLGAMEKGNLDGFDYLEFKESLQSLAKMPMDEATRYKSAFAMAKTMGATPDHLVKTASHYINLLKEEEHKFKQALANQRSRQIGDKEGKIKNLDAIIKNKMQQIEKLKADIKNHQTEMTKMKEEISSSVVKVETTKNNFVASFNAIVGQIHQDIEKMKQHLK